MLSHFVRICEMHGIVTLLVDEIRRFVNGAFIVSLILYNAILFKVPILSSLIDLLFNWQVVSTQAVGQIKLNFTLTILLF